jgi:hypothetical protein
MLKTDRTIRSGIMASIIASAVFLYFLDPILRSLARLLVYVYSFFGTKYVDRIYAQAAQLETNDYAFVLFTMFASLICGFVLARATFRIVRAFSTPTDESTKEKEQAHEVKKRRAPSKGFAIVRLGIAVCFVLFTGGVVAGNWMQLSLTSSFRQHMRIVAPYIDSQQEKRLMSECPECKPRQNIERFMRNFQKSPRITTFRCLRIKSIHSLPFEPDAQQSLVADGAIACFSSNLIPSG